MITILMAAYNGREYIQEQIESIISQTIQDYLLIVNDDCSDDDTYEIAKEYERNYTGKIFVRRNDENSGGAKYNFMHMMIEHKDDYVMLCDQDDIWLPNKIEKTLAKMREMETVYGIQTPMLIHTDLYVVDAKKKIVSSSFQKLMGLNYDKTALHNLLIQNIITGCTVMYNRALSNLINREPTYMIMHDWWLALLSATFGRIAYITEPTMLYRQHANNGVGAKDVRTLCYKLDRLMHSGQVKLAIQDTYSQAQSLLTQYLDRMSDEQKCLLHRYCEIPKLSKISKWRRVMQLKTIKNGLARNFAYFLYI